MKTEELLNARLCDTCRTVRAHVKIDGNWYCAGCGSIWG